MARSYASDAIIRTLSYADVFAFPLNREELRRFAITSKKLSQKDVDNGLKTLGRQVKCVGEWYCFSGRESIVRTRVDMQKTLKHKRTQAQRVAQFLGKIPTISAVYLTGGVAVGNVTKNDDIDFMIITKPGWLWTSRCIVVVMSKLLGKYTTKRPIPLKDQQHLKDTWCFNLWLDETSLTVPPAHQNVYTAHEVVQATPLFDRGGLKETFLLRNLWAQTYLPNMQLPKPPTVKPSNASWNPIDLIFFFIQRAYMSLSLTTERVGRTYAFFHPRNTSSIVLEKYRKLCRQHGVVE